ncbi:MAG: TPM domain-containing protein [Clostridia bacterium]|nr:TPM domain-containing protein [Clostridia bacterium]
MKIKLKNLSSFVFVTFLMMLLSFGAFASEGKNRLVDNAGLLDSSEFKSISSKLDEISERQNMDIVILTEKSLGGKSLESYADDYFDNNNYGIGGDRSGILLLIDMGERGTHISTSGYAIKVFTDAGIDHILEKITPELKDKDYDDAFEIFANLCDEFITKAKTDKPYDSGSLPKNPFNVLLWASIAILVGAVIAWLVVSYMKKQLKTVTQKAKADDYIQKNSLQIKNSRDIFLYSSIVRRARPKSSSGSSTHRSSSGRIHGGRSGRF